MRAHRKKLVQTGARYFYTKMTRDVFEKANSIIRKMITTPQEIDTPKKKTITPVGSPRTLAIKRTEIELEYIQENEIMNIAIKKKEEELDSAESVGNNQDSREYLRIQGELKVLKVSWHIKL